MQISEHTYCDAVMSYASGTHGTEARKVSLRDGRQTKALSWEENDVPWSLVNLRHEVVDDPQVKAMEAIWYFEHPQIGNVRQPRPAAQFSTTPANFHQPTAYLGQHNEEVLKELGYDDQQIEHFGEAGILHAERR